MEFLFELVLTLLVDGSVEIVKNEKLNIFLRIAAAALLIVFISGVLLVLLAVGIIVIVRGQYFYGGVIVALDALMIALAVKKAAKLTKKFIADKRRSDV